MLDVAGIDRKTRDPESPPFRERGFDVQFQIPIFDGGEVRVRQAAETYNQAFNLLTEKAVNVRSEARDAFGSTARPTTSPSTTSAKSCRCARSSRTRCSCASAACRSTCSRC